MTRTHGTAASRALKPGWNATIATMARNVAAALLTLFALLGPAAVAARAQLSFGSAVDLALRNSNAVHAAEADQAHAVASLQEVRDAYIPSLTLGSGLAYTNGFPIGDPSVVRLVAQGLLINFAQPDNLRAARAGVAGAQLDIQAQREQVVLDTALTYCELAATEGTLAALEEQNKEADRLVDLTQQRENAGLEAPIATKRAQLREAQARLKRLNLASRAAELRDHLSALTGIALAGLRVDIASIPAFPAIPDDPALPERAVAASTAVQQADSALKVKAFEAFAQHKVVLRPEVDLVSQYGYFSDINNYSTYYRDFSNSNLALGVQIQLPLFNAVQKARAREADADVVKARAQTQIVRAQVRESTGTLARAAGQTAAAEDVARLQHEISVADAGTVAAQADSGTGTGQPPVTPQQVSEARIAERQFYSDYLVARFEHVKAELTLMKATGGLEAWAQTGLAITPAR